MEKFTYFQDQKITVWDRVKFEVEADSQEDADNIVRNLGNQKIGIDEVDFVEFIDTEKLCDTEEWITVEGNDGFATLENYAEDMQTCLSANGKR